jgi:Tol biopolymer transport system component
VAVSADDRQVLFVANYEGQPHVWSREVDQVSARPLPGTGGATFPFWSPDSRSVAFHADGYLKRLDLDGGLVRILANATVGLGGSWNRDGVILFVRNPASAIARVSADGGDVTEVTQVEAGQVGHAFPHFLPDGTHFLFYVTAGPESRGVHLGQLGEAPSRRLLDADGGGVYANGHVLFVRQDGVYAQAFDAERLELAGRPFQVAEGIYGRVGGQSLTLSAGQSAFAFRSGATRNARQFTWVDRSGNQIAAVGDPLGNPDGVSWSPDLGQAVFFERGPSSSDLWTIDIRRGLVSRFSEEPDEDIFPLWTRDGTRIVYTAVRNGAHSLYSRQVDTGVRELLLPEQRRETFVSDVSPDGRQLLYQQMAPNGGFDIWALPLDGRVAAAIVQTDANERVARLSPDGRWLAFVANNSGAFEVYVQPFPGPGPRRQVSSRGGDQPQWRADGDELFYVSADSMLMAAPVTYATDRSSIDIGEPIALFAPGIGSASPVMSGNYHASGDGQRFLLNRLLPDASVTPVRVVLNWNAEAAAAER